MAQNFGKVLPFTGRAPLRASRPLARYRWNLSHSVWVRTPMPPPDVLENQPELPPMVKPSRVG